MPGTLHTNSLTIFLLKPEFWDPLDALREVASDQNIWLEDGGRVFYSKSRSIVPLWVNRFFIDA